MRINLVFAAAVAAMQCVGADAAALSGDKSAGGLDLWGAAMSRLDSAQAALEARLAAQEAQAARFLDLIDSRDDLRRAYHGPVVAQYVLTNANVAVTGRVVRTGRITRYVLHEDGRVFTNAAAKVARPDPEAARKAALAAEQRQIDYEARVLPPEIAALRARRRAAEKGLVYNEKTRQAE